MSGSKFSATAAAVSLLNDACSPLGIPIKIAAFTERSPKCEHYIVKEYDQRVTNDSILSDYCKISQKLHQNADGESIMWAARDLILRPEERKILVVLSDGSPASDNAGDCFTYTVDVVAHWSKYMELYGIGILDSTVDRIYPESTVLKKTYELETCLLDLIKKKIFK